MDMHTGVPSVVERGDGVENAAQNVLTIGLGVPGSVVVSTENVVDTVVEVTS